MKRLEEDVEKYLQEFIKTKAFVAKKPHTLSIITPELCSPLEEEYNRYTEIQKKLCLDNIILSREEFLIKKENPVYCAYISVSSPFLGLYSVYDDKTARYANNAKEVLKKDFSDKWY